MWKIPNRYVQQLPRHTYPTDKTNEERNYPGHHSTLFRTNPNWAYLTITAWSFLIFPNLASLLETPTSDKNHEEIKVTANMKSISMETDETSNFARAKLEEKNFC